jgi:hypothetical protein
MEIFSQQDPRWSKMKLGQSPCTMGRYGCLTTAVTMYHDWVLKRYSMPSYVCGKLLYTNDGLLKWDSLGAIGLKLVSRVDKRDDAAIKKALLHPTQGVMLQVNNNHWLFLIGKTIFGSYKVVDPWTGEITTTKKYNDNVTGFAIIDKK